MSGSSSGSASGSASGGRDLTPGEYVDVTVSWSKRAEVLRCLRHSRPQTHEKRSWLVLALLIAPLLVLDAINLIGSGPGAGGWPLVIGGSALKLGVIVAGGFAVACGEPMARFRRVYAGPGRLDIVRAGRVTSYTRAEHTVGDPKFDPARPGLLEIRGPGFFSRQMWFVPSDAATVRAMWDLPEIAPPFGSEPGRSGRDLRDGFPDSDI